MTPVDVIVSVIGTWCPVPRALPTIARLHTQGRAGSAPEGGDTMSARAVGRTLLAGVSEPLPL